MGVGSFFKLVGDFVEFGAKQQAHQNTLSTYDYNKRQLEFAAQSEDRAAVDAMSRGSFTAGLVRRKATQAIQEQRLAFAASGVDSGFGTPVDVAESTRANSEADVQQYLNNAARDAWGHSEVGRKYRIQKKQIGDQERAAIEAKTYEDAASTIKVVGDFADIVGSMSGG